jgi:hypothetical protein
MTVTEFPMGERQDGSRSLTFLYLRERTCIMAVLEHLQTGERRELDGELPFGATYVVEGYDEENDELWEEERIDLDGEEYKVIDDGVDMVEIDSTDE